MNKREIKFRIFDGENMVYGWTDIETSMPLMQYVGLKDKNEVEIYEGDIVHFYRPDDGNETLYIDGPYADFFDWNGVYGFKEGEFKIVEGWRSSTKQHKDKSIFDKKYEEKEVIGNIYENSSLVKFSK
jgi:uncharacterized phage protein (TIGR01671 family)